MERAWAWNGLGTLSWNGQGNIAQSLVYYHKALESWPDFPTVWNAISNQEYFLGHAEAALFSARKWVEVARINSASAILATEQTGDYTALFHACADGTQRPNSGTVQNHDFYQLCALVALASQHDGKGARDWLRNMPPVEALANNSRGAEQRLRASVALKDWQAVAAQEPEAEKIFLKYTPTWDLTVYNERLMRPMLALAKAELGDGAGAETLIGKSPADCYDCVRYRGLIAAAAKEWGRADYWFAKAVHDAPSVPFAYAAWGQALLERGDPDAAIAKFTIANQKGPKFADPLEGWGEALMAKNRSDLALAKFEEAEKYTPNWGRLHLKWGEALGYSGKNDEAQKQFALTAGLDLSAADKAELTRVSGHG